MLSKALLYTAVTRARHKLNLLASSEALLAGLARDTRRMSGLGAIAAFNER
jgi:ATP-dependent exoDNAse (exonuclease V) alpha subunit